MNKDYILWFKEIKITDIPIVGGKNASLGDMYQELTEKGIKVPNGFATTVGAYHHILESNGILKDLKAAMKGLNKNDIKDLSRRGRNARNLILNSGIPQDLWEDIASAYDKLCKEYGEEVDVAVRSSATAEDLPTASFAGQQETYLNIRGHNSLKEACIKCFASLFTDRAIAYRVDKNFDHFKIGISIGIQKMVRSDLSSSGVMFTLDTESGFRDVVFITASYGLGENIVQGTVNPDEYYVFKPTLEKGYKPIIRKKLGEKKIKMIYGVGESKALTRNIEVSASDRKKFCITDDDVLKLAEYAIVIEKHYSKIAGKAQHKDIEWAKDGLTGDIYIVQSRPETVQSLKSLDVLEIYSLDKKSKVILNGKSVGEKISSGSARIVENIDQLHKFKPGEVLISNTTNPDWEPVMKTASAIVTNRGGRTCHAAIISRELGIPAVVGALDATEKIKNGQGITVSCAEGDEGIVYNGILPINIKRINLKKLKRPKTKIMLNIGNPDIAFSNSKIPNDGVGLARIEFIINSYIKIHPMALIQFDKVKDSSTKKEINNLTHGYINKEDYFIDKLAQGVGTIASAFYPKPVIARMSDFKTNEYKSLLGGKYFEPDEENPMMGFRGASRYYSDLFRDAFALECKAMKKVRDEMGLTNLLLMIPFCRRVEEGKKVLSEMKDNGLVQGKNDLEIYVMCELPNNVLLMDEFSRLFDGFSIGSNDLTQFSLGVDRDSELISHDFDERDPGIIKLISMAIKGARRNKRKIGICGQAPSDYPEFAEFLVKEGINSISLTPDSAIKTTLKVLRTEKKLKK